MLLKKVIKPLFLLLIIWIIFLPKNDPIQAVGSDLFITPTGSTTSGCVQSHPCDLSTALSLAGDDDTLYFSAGTYHGSGLNPVVTVDKDLIMYGGWDGSTISPPLVDPETNISILDGEDSRQVVAIINGSTSLLDGFTITSGQAQDGAGIYVENASVTIQNNIITDNHTIDGGFYKDGRGGGIYIEGGGQTTLYENTISENSAGFGGGYFNFGIPVTIQGNRFLNNQALHRGGGMLIEGGSDFVQGNVFINNSSTGDGGAIIIWSSDPVIAANRFEANIAADGSAISMGNDSQPEIYNNILVNHSGSTVYVFGSMPQLINNNFIGTNTSNTKGIEMMGPSDCIPPYCPGGIYYNNIITGFDKGIDIRTNVLGNLSMDFNAYWSNNQDYDLPPSVDPGTQNIYLDPQFVDGPNGDFHLNPSSPCIDTGTLTGAPADDFDGTPRPLGFGVDIGAYEQKQHVYLPLIIK